MKPAKVEWKIAKSKKDCKNPIKGSIGSSLDEMRKNGFHLTVCPKDYEQDICSTLCFIKEQDCRIPYCMIQLGNGHIVSDGKTVEELYKLLESIDKKKTYKEN